MIMDHIDQKGEDFDALHTAKWECLPKDHCFIKEMNILFCEETKKGLGNQNEVIFDQYMYSFVRHYHKISLPMILYLGIQGIQR